MALACLLAMPLLARAQDKPGDDALDQIMKKLDQPKPAEGADQPSAVKPEDKDLDSLLKKLGQTPEEAAPKDKPHPGEGLMPTEPKPPAETKPAGEAKPGNVKDQDKSLDEHLRELLGRKPKPKKQGEQGGAGGSDDGPLTETIKKMEEVRQRLVKSDTGEATRKTQGEVIKELDGILQKLRQAQSQSSGSKQKKQMSVAQAGNQGNKPGDQPTPNPTGKGTGPQKPSKPKLDQVLAASKDTWGDLPPSLRAEMENVFKEDMLPAKRDLIIRYYSSVAKKGRSGGQ